MDHHRERRHGDASTRLGEAVVPPVGLEHRLEARARGLLVLQRHAVGEADDPRGLVAGKIPAVGDRRLDDEGTSAIHRRWTSAGRIELASHLLQQTRQQRLRADRLHAGRRRRRNPDLLDRRVETLRLVVADLLDPAPIGKARPATDLLRGGRADPAELLLEEGPELCRAGPLQHLDQGSQLDAHRMGLDLLGVRRQFLDGSVEEDLLAGRRAVLDAGVRVRDRGLLEIFVDRLASLEMPPLEFDRDLGAVSVWEAIGLARTLLVADDVGAIAGGVHLQDHLVHRRLGGGAAEDDHRLAGRHEAVHAGRGDSDALLAPAHLQAMELGSVQQATEDVLDLLAHDARPVVANEHLEAGLRQRQQLDAEIGQHPRLLAGVEGVVDRLLDGGQQRLAGIVEAEEVSVLREELADRDLALPRRELLGGGPASARAAAGGLASSAGQGRGLLRRRGSLGRRSRLRGNECRRLRAAHDFLHGASKPWRRPRDGGSGTRFGGSVGDRHRFDIASKVRLPARTATRGMATRATFPAPWKPHSSS